LNFPGDKPTRQHIHTVVDTNGNDYGNDFLKANIVEEEEQYHELLSHNRVDGSPDKLTESALFTPPGTLRVSYDGVRYPSFQTALFNLLKISLTFHTSLHFRSGNYPVLPPCSQSPFLKRITVSLPSRIFFLSKVNYCLGLTSHTTSVDLPGKE